MSSSIQSISSGGAYAGPAQPAGGDALAGGSVAAKPTDPVEIRFISPVVQLDPEAGLAVLRLRDSESGAVRLQIPAERVVREYKTYSNDEKGQPDTPAASKPTATPPTAEAKAAEPKQPAPEIATTA